MAEWPTAIDFSAGQGKNSQNTLCISRIFYAVWRKKIRRLGVLTFFIQGLIQPQQQEQPQGDDQVHVVPLHQQEQDDQDQQDIPAVQLLQPEDFQDAVDPPLVPAEQGVQRALLP